MEVGGQCHTLAALLLGKRPSTLCIGGWMGFRDRYGRSCLHQVLNPDHSDHGKLGFIV